MAGDRQLSPTQQQPHSEAPDASTPPIATEALFRRTMGRAEFTTVLLRELEATGPQHVRTLQRGVAKGDAHATGEAAHSLKGAAAIVCAEKVRTLAAEIESLAKSSRLQSTPPLVGELEIEMNRCLAQIPEILAEAAST